MCNKAYEYQVGSSGYSSALQRETLQAICGSKTRSGASGGLSDTRMGTVYMALLQREPLYVFCGLEARSSASGKNVGKTGTMAEMVNALIPSKGQ